MIRKTWKRISQFVRRYINGTKGAITLFLAILMTPMLSLSLLIVESARYQNAIQLMNELADLCGMSAMGDYDKYLQSRFGLLSTGQQTEVSVAYTQYMRDNIAMMGTSVELLDGTSAKGKYPLATESVLRQQIVEQSEISVISKTLYEAFDIDELVSKLKELFKADKLEKIMNTVNSGADMANTVASLLDGAVKIKKAYDAYGPAYTAYEDAYSKLNEDDEEVGFYVDMMALIPELAAAEAALEEDEDHDNIYKEKAVKDAISVVDDSTKDYRKKAEALKKALKELRDSAKGFVGTLSELSDKYLACQTANKTEAGEKYYNASTSDWVVGLAGEILKRCEGIISDSFTDDVTDDMEELEEQVRVLNELRDKKFKNVDSEWDSSDVESRYQPVGIDSIKSDFSSTINMIINALDSEVKTETLSFSYLLELVDKIMNIQILYDSSLDSVVNQSYLHTSAKKNVTDTLLVESITSVYNSIDSFKSISEKEGFWGKVVELLKAIGSMLLAIVEFIGAIVTFVAELLVGVVKLGEILFNPGEVYNDLLTYGWAAYNMPNRVTCTSEKSLTGYSYLNVFLQNGGDLKEYDSGTFGGSMGANLSAKGGSDPAFKGAVQEYLMVGSLSEYENQAVAFFKIYFFRIALNLYQVLTNKELSAMAAAAGPAGIAIKILVGIAEPFLDTVFLVNGQKEHLLKDYLYISPSGISNAVKKLAKMTLGQGLSGLISNEMEKKMSSQKKTEDSSTDNESGDTGGTGGTDDTGETGGTGDKGESESGTSGKGKSYKFFECSYGDHLYLLSFIMASDGEYMKRIQNVIQMEAAQYYSANGGYAFDLDNAYTYIMTETKYRVSPIFSFDVLENGGAFDISEQRYVGY